MMDTKKENVLLNKTYAFAIRIVNLSRHLYKKNEPLFARQIFRSGTSIEANAEEAQGAISTKDFILKLQIAYKEARETMYWIRLMRDTGVIEESAAESLLKDNYEINAIMTSILKTMKNKNS